MKRASLLLLALASLGIAQPASADEQKILPGLWEHSFTMKSQSGQIENAMSQFQEQMAALPEDRRKLMEQMMAAQGVTLSPSGSTFRVCITEEDAARDTVPQMDGNCTQKIEERSGNTLRVSFDCAGDPPTRGEGEVTFISPKAYKGKAVIDTEVDGKPERMNIEQSGKWLAADCGDIQPRTR
ncbi:hypothetical protein DESUT3_15390 [Desulfuromonas versatilis]|uniref:DUF3617 domain-containing protein n=1 Tax=Desulfuromonas versatilis TaxID=2802975 RepID=A0ABM8HVB8_9BACT|nr:DUF3617 domain-containing protein [Desulfuromonas versatilis]BCR04470.1 hypothetical protein DESUT3_15390 [Desulfuromonas versatilis]